MVLSAMELVRAEWPPERLLVKEGHLRTALSWLTALEPGFERAMGEMAMARRTSLADLIVRHLTKPRRRGKWISRRMIQRAVWYRCQSGKELRGALQSLVEVEKVRVRERERGIVEYRARRGASAGIREVLEAKQAGEDDAAAGDEG
jgi:hypothetical protein